MLKLFILVIGFGNICRHTIHKFMLKCWRTKNHIQFYWIKFVIPKILSPWTDCPTIHEKTERYYVTKSTISFRLLSKSISIDYKTVTLNNMSLSDGLGCSNLLYFNWFLVNDVCTKYLVTWFIVIGIPLSTAIQMCVAGIYVRIGLACLIIFRKRRRHLFQNIYTRGNTLEQHKNMLRFRDIHIV